MVSENTELHSYCVQKLYLALIADISQQQLCKVAVWTMGEFGDLIVAGPIQDEGESKQVGSDNNSRSSSLKVVILLCECRYQKMKCWMYSRKCYRVHSPHLQLESMLLMQS